MKLCEIKPLDGEHPTGRDIPSTMMNEELASVGAMDNEPTTPPDAELGAETEIDAAVSKVFAAETIQDKIDRVAIAMQIFASIILRGVRQ